LDGGGQGGTRQRSAESTLINKVATGSSRLELERHFEFGLEIIDRIILEDRHAGLERHGNGVCDFSADRKVERQEEPAGLTGIGAALCGSRGLP
jgi:hypothetical protein